MTHAHTHTHIFSWFCFFLGTVDHRPQWSQLMVHENILVCLMLVFDGILPDLYKSQNWSNDTTTILLTNQQWYHCRKWHNSRSPYVYHIVIFFHRIYNLNKYTCYLMLFNFFKNCTPALSRAGFTGLDKGHKYSPKYEGKTKLLNWFCQNVCWCLLTLR